MSRTPGDDLSPKADHRADYPTDGVAGRLGDRLERLPPGHPSSPYEPDGSPRQPALRLRDYDVKADDEDLPADHAPAANDGVSEQQPDASQQFDLPNRYTDAEWSDHKAETEVLLAEADAAGLASDIQHTVDPNHQVWSRERTLAHDSIIESIYERAHDVPNEYSAIIAGGLCGAGKTTVLSDYADIDRSQYLTISPDEIKEELAQRGLVPEVTGLSPMEASDLVHKESSYIARQLALRAREDGKNLIWDITMSSRDSTEERISDLRAAGYHRVDAIFVEIPVGVSLQRADGRHRAGEDDYRSGIGLGGRYVPPDAITSQADPEWGSKNRKAFEDLKPQFDRWSRYDNSVNGRSPNLAETSMRDDNLEESTS